MDGGEGLVADTTHVHSKGYVHCRCEVLTPRSHRSRFVPASNARDGGAGLSATSSVPSPGNNAPARMGDMNASLKCPDCPGINLMDADTLLENCEPEMVAALSRAHDDAEHGLQRAAQFYENIAANVERVRSQWSG